jgi:hypothetical protein
VGKVSGVVGGKFHAIRRDGQFQPGFAHRATPAIVMGRLELCDCTLEDSD